jgi:phytoene/squalene synthetase
MPKEAGQLRAKLKWEAACERLRNTLRPPAGAPVAAEADDLRAAYWLAREALDQLGAAFQFDVSPDPDTSGTDTPP